MADNVKVGDRVTGEGNTIDKDNWVKQMRKIEAAEK